MKIVYSYPWDSSDGTHYEVDVVFLNIFVYNFGILGCHWRVALLDLKAGILNLRRICRFFYGVWKCSYFPFWWYCEFHNWQIEAHYTNKELWFVHFPSKIDKMR